MGQLIDSSRRCVGHYAVRTGRWMVGREKIVVDCCSDSGGTFDLI